MTTDLVTRSGKGAALSAANHDQNIESLSGTVDAKTSTPYKVLYTDQNKTIEVTSAGAFTLQLDAIATLVGSGGVDTTKFRVKIKNLGTGTVTVSPNGSETIDGAASYAVEQYEFVEIQVNAAGLGWNILSSLYTAARIKTLYESNSDTNEFSDAEQTKLAYFTALSGNVTATQSELNVMDGVTASTAEVNLLTGKSLASSDNVIDNFPAGTAMLFYQSAAPTGWTKDTTANMNDHGLRLVTTTAWSGGTKGSVAFSTVFGRTASDSTTLTTNQIPAHKHGISPSGAYGMRAVSSNIDRAGTSSWDVTASPLSTDNYGGGLGHTHPMDLRVKYVNLILATKN